MEQNGNIYFSDTWYYRTWSLQIYDGTYAYGVEFSMDDGKTWTTIKTFSTENEADYFMWEKLLIIKNAKEWTSDIQKK